MISEPADIVEQSEGVIRRRMHGKIGLYLEGDFWVRTKMRTRRFVCGVVERAYDQICVWSG